VNTYVKRKVRRLPAMATRASIDVFLDYLRRNTPEREQKVMAGRAGISETTFSRWMSGRLVPNPTLSTLEKIARAYRTTVAALVSEDAQIPPEKQRALEAYEKVRAVVAEAQEDKGTQR